MSYPVDLCLYQQPVLVIGGGNVALRKIKQCLEEGAYVHVFAKAIKTEIMELGITCVSGEYDQTLLDDFLLCIICSDDELFNQSVWEDCEKKHKLCMGAHQKDRVNCRPMVAYEHDLFQLACSTNGNFPAITRQLTTKAGNWLLDQEKQRLSLLKELRILLQSLLPSQKCQAFCRLLANFSLELLDQCKKLLDAKKVYLLCFHGVKNLGASSSIMDYQETLQKRYPDVFIFHAFLAKSVCDAINKEITQVLYLDDIMEYLIELKKDILLIPMLFQNGKYYEQIKKWETFKNCEIADVFFSKEENIRKFFDFLLAEKRAEQIVICYHSSKQGTFSHLLQKVVASYPEIILSMDATLPMEHQLFGKTIQILPFFMLAGKHLLEDSEKMQVYLQAKGFQTILKTESILTSTFTKTCLIEHEIS